MKLLPRAAAIFLLATLASAQQPEGLLGDWKSKAGSIVRIEHCGSQICMHLVQIFNTGGATTDFHNPDAALRTRPLCGLQIGSFTLSDPDHASSGTLYDPKTGKTYRGNITAEGSMLHLRGYIGIPLFGASENWIRPNDPIKPCTAAGN